jgi:NADPH-dependent 2,4-dienoyl-CoA reductase/sulfur reductase-like enzyme/rhodanese-related sulfurtransferase
MRDPERILIVGGVAGGASAAARARRLCERCQIIVFDRGPFVSFANCGLPYFVGSVIQEEKDLIVASPELFRDRFNIEVRTRSEVLSVDRDRAEVEVRDLETGRVYREAYTKLVLAPGARAVRPPLPGIDLPGIFVVRTIPDSRRIRAWIHEKRATGAVVVGGGFIGLEMAENLAHRGLKVTVLEMSNQVLPPLDPEMAVYVEQHLREKGVGLRLGDAVVGFEPGPRAAGDGEGLRVNAASGESLATDFAILAIGVRPETALAEGCGLELGERGGIRVDTSMRTSDPDIFAVGDVVEGPDVVIGDAALVPPAGPANRQGRMVTDVVTGEAALVPLAGPANRQGRMAADAIFGRPSTFRGVQGTAVCGVFGLTVAMTGASERSLRRAGRQDFEAVYLHPGHHVGYYPGARKIHLKLIFARADGRILGAQAVGEAGVARRIDVIALAIQKQGTVFDLEEAELCYAPQFGAAKDPINLAGMVASNVLRGDHPLAHWSDLDVDRVCLVDVREPDEFKEGHVPHAVNIPLEQMRGRLDELPDDRETWLYCVVGQRAYYATRALLQHGYRVRNLSGGFQTFQAFQGVRPEQGGVAGSKR